MSGVDVVVAGNGVLGLSLGLVLARQGLKVTVLGEPHRPGAASVAAGAMLGAIGEVTDVLLSSEHGRSKLELGIRALGTWDDWLAGLAEDTGAEDDVLAADGTVVLLNGVGVASIDDANFAAIRRAAAEYDQPCHDIDVTEVEWINPDNAGRPFRAVHLPDEHAVDSHRLLQRLERAFTARGGVLAGESAASLEYTGGAVTGVVLTSGTRIEAGQVVLAAGTRTQDILDTAGGAAGRIPRLVAGFGVSALLDTDGADGPRSVLRTPNRAFACGLHLVPRSGGQVYVGATNIISPTVVDKPVVRDLHFLLDCATRQLHRDLWTSGIRAAQVGNRPVSLDGFPLIGPTELDGLWLLTGTYRDGLHLSPLLAQEVAALITGGGTGVDLTGFHPVRQAIQPHPRHEVISTAVAHLLATGYEYDWHLPVDWPRTIEHSLRIEFARFADEIHPGKVPPAEILAAARYSPVLVKMLRELYAD
ncbi:glycine/D-amino acid oxidase-like deaminating enzyme [Actinokineospora baliensis]|uniref:NAD(P)/FAD-dependent oxidoreductase n=1 Tax=Actinokineospora baliensis TaxID=547056 RepID=UPI001959EF25|nr:FAD-dependent oxidoreductase [Actinokineospora baliensis]MBM7776050.1 glycine/D-amino acid oxidase-like deaminating enzyme [Actinokineospora baliensis]